VERRDDVAARQGSSDEVAGATGVHGIETNGTGRLPTFLRRSWMAHGDEQATAARKQRWRRKPRVSMAVAHGVWRLGHGWRRSRGGGALNSPVGHLGVQATREDACSRRTRSRRRSLGRSRCEEGDDRWAPSVSHCRRRRRWLGRVREETGRRPCWAGLAGRHALGCAARAGAEACCRAGLLG
jgi:hypothetical protein